MKETNYRMPKEIQKKIDNKEILTADEVDILITVRNIEQSERIWLGIHEQEQRKLRERNYITSPYYQGNK